MVEHYSAMKRNESLLLVGRWMELEIITLRDMSLAQKVK
jgi:hypothetical protein